MGAAAVTHSPWPRPHLGTSAIVGIAVLAVLWADAFGGGTVGIRTAAGLATCVYLSIACHETAHAAMARLVGARVHRITVHAWGGLTEYARDGVTAGREALIAAAGPAVNIVIAAVGFALSDMPGWLGPLATAVAGANLLLAMFNLLPAAPLDGGLLVKAAVWRAVGSEYRGAVVAAWCGRVLGAGIGVAPFLLIAAGTSVSVGAVVSSLLFATYLIATASASLYAARIDHHTADLTAAQVCRPAAVRPPSGGDPGSGVCVEVSADGTPAWVTVDGAGGPAVSVPADAPFAEVVDATREVGGPIVVVDSGGTVAGVAVKSDLDARMRAAARNHTWST